MARGKNEAHNLNRKVGRGHPLLAELKEQRKASGFTPNTSSLYDRDLEERLRQRPRAADND